MRFLAKFLTIFIVLLVLILIIFFLSQIKSQKKFSANNSNSIASLFSIKPINDFFNNAFQKFPTNIARDESLNASSETLDEAEKTIEEESLVQAKQTIKNFDKIIREIDKEMILKINPLLKQIRIDKNKKDAEYIDEARKIIGLTGFSKIDLSNTKTLETAGNYYNQQSIALSRINPSTNFQKFHIFWTTSFVSRAYIFKELSKETNPERIYALLNILDSVIDSEAKIINQF